MGEFFDVVHQAVQLPLGIDLLAAAQRETVESLVVPEVAKDRFDGGKASCIEGAALFAVDGIFHPVGGTSAVASALSRKKVTWRTMVFSSA